jgi:hypothetical protein
VELEGMIDDRADEVKDVSVVSEEVIIVPTEEVAAPIEEEAVSVEVAQAIEAAQDKVAAPVEETEVPVKEEVIEDTEEAVPAEEAIVAEPIEAPVEETLIVTEQIEAPVEEAPQETKPPKESDKQSKAEIVDKLSITITKEASDSTRNEVDALKQSFYKLRRIETEAEKKAFMDAGGAEENFFVTPDPLEEKLKEYLAAFREKRSAWNAAADRMKEQNLLLKKNILEKLQVLSESKDDFYEVYEEFKKLQQQWKEIKQVPQSAVNELWKEYQSYSERFYDLRKINNEMREYDFKKNLELKQTLCETVERLIDEPDVVSAFRQMQTLRLEWREIGPVAYDLRHKIWSRFEKATTVIYKRHQAHFETKRDKEEENLQKKTALCEEMENIDYSLLLTVKDWDKENKSVLDRQSAWRTIGHAPKGVHGKIFDRFRASCNLFFKKKNEFYKNSQNVLEENLQKKQLLCEQAETLKDSHDWRDATDQFIALQKEWRAIGPIPRKHVEAIRKRFGSACDYFFEQKSAHFHSQKSEESDHLKKKKELISQINALDPALPADQATALLNQYMAEFHRTGFVPFRDKDKIQKEFQKAIDKQYDRLHMNENDRLLQSFRSNLGDGGESKNRILGERKQLMRSYDKLRSDIQTYENNMGFLSVSSKTGGGLVQEMQRKIEALKEELLLIEKKIEVIDQNLEA